MVSHVPFGSLRNALPQIAHTRVVVPNCGAIFICTNSLDRCIACRYTSSLLNATANTKRFIMNYARTCRFCHCPIWDNSDNLKYGTRHCAHIKCYAGSGRDPDELMLFNRQKFDLWQAKQAHITELLAKA